MVVRPELTPNPNALKFSVGRETGEPKTFVKGGPEGDPIATALLALEGVVSVFMTADFVTLTKAPTSEWSEIKGPAQEILEQHFG